MPQAVTHILIPILLIALFRDYFVKDKSKFPLHYVLIAGLGGVLPDIDIPISLVLKTFGIVSWSLHKTLTHSIFFPLTFLIIGLLLRPTKEKARICRIRNHELKWSSIFFILAFGTATHIFLDILVWEGSFLFYPFLNIDFGIKLLRFIPENLRNTVFALMDGIFLVIWISYLELKHKISDFI